MEVYRRNQPNDKKRQQRRRKSKIKSIIIIVEFLIIITLIISIVVLGVKYNSIYDKLISGDAESNNDFVSSVDTTSNNSSVTKEEELLKELDMWYLKLVGPNNHVSNDFISGVELAEIDERFSSGHTSSKYFDKRAVEYFNDMCKAALEDNVSIISVSSYRTYSYQNTLYNNRVQRFINQGYNEADAKATAATIVAVPGSSEHHMGLAVDINEVEEKFEKTNAFKWLQENAADYGFIMRYPKDKQNITKIIYEPWHYRYVGVEHAKAMNELDMCLEEYIEYIKNGCKR